MADGRIGKYTIVGEIGAGAMGVVYKAVDPYIGRTVAIKTIRFDILTNPQQREEAQKRFLREAQSAGNLSHPNIVTIYDVGEDQGLTYIAMEYIEGRSLEDILAAQQPWDLGAAVNLIIQIAEGLDSAHRKGIVHRDIKPGNILVDREGRPKIVDFGIARISSSSLTQTSMVMGTPFYMSPEQVAGKKVDHRADIFAVGAIFYEILSLQKPFAGDTLTTIIYKIMNEVPPPLAQVVGGIPEALDAIIQKCLAKNPEARYQGCQDLVYDLRGFAASIGYAVATSVAIPASTATVRRKKKKEAPAEMPAAGEAAAEPSRRPLLIVLGLMLVVVAAVVVALLVMKKKPGRTMAQGGGGAPPATQTSGQPPPAAPQETSSQPAITPSKSGEPDKTPPNKPVPEIKKGESREPRLVRDVKPEYPVIARQARVEGEVLLEVAVGPDGSVTDVVVVHSVPLLDEAAVKAARQYIFDPALKDGTPAEGKATVSVTFSLPAEPAKTEPPPKTETQPTKVTPPPPKTGETREARVSRRVEPEYPDLAREARIEGDVDVQVTIGPTGRIERAVVVKGVGLLDKAALNAVRQWTFEPALRDGLAVASVLTFTLQFRLAAPPSTSKVEPNRPTPKPIPSKDSEKPPAPPAGSTGKPSAAAATAAELSRASEAMNRKNYREAVASARRVLTANPASEEAQSILTNGLIQIAPVEIKNLVDQYILSLKVKQPVEFYRLHAVPALFARVKKDMDIVMGAYDQLQASGSNLSLNLKEMRYPTYRAEVAFSHLVTGVSRQKGLRETLFDGRYTWRLELQNDAWLILEITFQSAR